MRVTTPGLSWADRSNGPGGKRVVYHAVDGQATRPCRFDSERGVVDRAQARAGDNEQGQFETEREIGDEDIFRDGHQQPAHAFDEHAIAGFCEAVKRAEHGREVDLPVLARRGEIGRERVAQSDGVDTVEGLPRDPLQQVCIRPATR